MGTVVRLRNACEAYDGLKKWGRELPDQIQTRLLTGIRQFPSPFFQPITNARRPRIPPFVVSLYSLGPPLNSLNLPIRLDTFCHRQVHRYLETTSSFIIPFETEFLAAAEKVQDHPARRLA